MSLTEEASEGAAAASAPPNSSPTTAAPTYDASLFVKGMFVDAWCAQEHAWQPATIVALSDGQAKVHFQQHYSTIAVSTHETQMHGEVVHPPPIRYISFCFAYSLSLCFLPISLFLPRSGCVASAARAQDRSTWHDDDAEQHP